MATTYRIDQHVVNVLAGNTATWRHVGTFTLAQARKRYGKIEFLEMQEGFLPNFVVTAIANNGFLLQGE